NVSWMGFTLGGAFRRDNMGFRSNNTDRTDYGVGLRYTTGPWRFGVEWGETERGRGILYAAGTALSPTSAAIASVPGGVVGTGAVASRAGPAELQHFGADA